MSKVTLTFVRRTPKTSASGKPYTSLSIKTQEHGDKYLSGFGNKDNEGWNEGDTVEIETKEVVKDGKTYLNFETPKKAALNEEMMHAIRFLVSMGRNIEGLVAENNRLLKKALKVDEEPELDIPEFNEETDMPKF